MYNFVFLFNIPEAWDEQTQTRRDDHQTAPPMEHQTSIHPTEDSDDEYGVDMPLQRHQLPEEGSTGASFFLTERQVCKRLRISINYCQSKFLK